MFANVGLLFIEPEQPASPAPVLDPATRRMCGAFRKAIRSDYSYRGFHTCFCGARSDSYDWTLPNGQLTNSLCVHYVAHHRPDVPAEQLLCIESFAGEAHPGESELQGPGPILDRFRLTVAVRLGRKRLRTWTAWGLDAEAVCLGLQGRPPAAVHGYSCRRARNDAEGLLTLLEGIEAASLPRVKAEAERSYGDVRAWGRAALRTPGWQPEAWVAPLMKLFRQSEGSQQLAAGDRLRLLGPAVGPVVPDLIDLAATAAADANLQRCVGEVLERLGLLDHLPPRPGQPRFCEDCRGSGACYCLRKRPGHSDQCPRCDGTGRCHLCRGAGRRPGP